MARCSKAYYLIPATALSRIGTVAYTIVVTWYISQHAGQQMVGVMNALSGAGIFLASILGFVVIDRFKKKSLLIFYTDYSFGSYVFSRDCVQPHKPRYYS